MKSKLFIAVFCAFASEAVLREFLFIYLFIGERSEPLSRVFNDPTRGIYIYIWWNPYVRTYVSNTHAHVRMSVCY